MSFNLESALYSVPAVVLGLTVHEFSHAAAAYALGDETSKAQGRLSLNPLVHLDPIGLLFIIAAGFGWAKPVSFNRGNLKSPKRDIALIAIAGPLSNLALGIVAMLFLKLWATVIPHSAAGVYPIIVNVLIYLGFINFGLFIFNMIPIPPLDGSHVLFCWLKIKDETEKRLYKFGMPLLFAILILEATTHIDILPIGKIIRSMGRFFFTILNM